MNYSDIETRDALDFSITSKPYIIRNYAKNWRAYKKWSFEYLKNLEGADLPVNVVRGNAAASEGKILSIKFNEYIDKIVSDRTVEYLTTFYLFQKFPNLKEHIEYKNIKKRALMYHLLSWIGPKGSITGFHCDWSENINIQIRGEKNFYLVSPEYNQYMYISEKFERISWTSQVDLKKIDESKFPLFKKAKLLKVNLKESDAIYIPRGWWHYVESLSPSVGVSMHYWSFFNFFRDLLFETSKVLLHDVGLYKKNNCSCHFLNDKGKRLKRG